MDSQRSLCGGRSSGATKRIGALALFAPCVLAAFAVAGCGGSSSGADLGPAAKFLGRWERDTATMFAVTCTQVSGTFNPWTELQFERGVLSDASETSTVCTRPSGLAFDVDKTGAALALTAPDPYTGAAPDCAIDLGPDANGLPVYLDLTFTSFDFTLLAVVKDKAPTAILSLAATGVIAQDDGTGTNTYVQVDTCNYTGTNDTYHRMSQP